MIIKHIVMGKIKTDTGLSPVTSETVDVSKLLKAYYQELDDEGHHKGPKDAYKNSLTAKQILELGEEVIPEIGKYLDGIFGTCKKEKDINPYQKQGWIHLLTGIVQKHEIDTKKVFAYDFLPWLEWTKEYKIWDSSLVETFP